MRSLVIISMAMILFTGCKKEEEKPVNKASVTIDNVNTSFSDIMYSFDPESKSYYITSFDDEMMTKNIAVSVKEPVTGENNFSVTTIVNIGINGKSYVSKAGGGKITITKNEGGIFSGNFSGTFCYDVEKEILISGTFTAQELKIPFKLFNTFH